MFTTMTIKENYGKHYQKVNNYNFGANDKKFLAGALTMVDIAKETMKDIAVAPIVVAVGVPITAASLTMMAVEELKNQTIKSYEQYVQENGTQI